jgi:predicted nucleotidyltransferase
MKIILKTLVGSHAHGLAGPDSDRDYRGVFVLPTSDILSLGNRKMQTSWTDGTDDDTSWEIGHFLMLATKCNPTILETFLAPITESNEDGLRMRELFPHLWNSHAVRDAFIGYGLNQRKKMLENKEKRDHKYAAAYLRTLYNAHELLTTGTFNIRIADTEVGETVRAFKSTKEGLKYGEVIDVCRLWEEKVRVAFEANPDKQTNIEPVNEFLLDMRKKYWSV